MIILKTSVKKNNGVLDIFQSDVEHFLDIRFNNL